MRMAVDCFHARLVTPFAVVGVRTVGERLDELVYLPKSVATLAPVTPFAARVCAQIEAYLEDASFCFDLPFEYVGTAYQNRVWKTVHDIPAGKTMTYSAIAKLAGSAPRPVGMACGANRIPLVIPCHRVTASRGIGGFMHAKRGPGIEIKRWLLRHEGAEWPQ